MQVQEIETFIKGIKPVKTFFSSFILPVYFGRYGDYSVFYSPGKVFIMFESSARRFQDILQGKMRSNGEDDLDKAASNLIEHAVNVHKAREKEITREFIPKCLTLYLHEQCRFNCKYCISRERKNSRKPINPNSVKSAARYVLDCCRQKKIPMTTVYHGWGEPTQDFHLLKKIIEIIEDYANKYRVSLYNYLATNGQLTSDQALYLSKKFDSIGISCDGPENIQGKQRPDCDLALIKEAAHIMKEEGVYLSIRTTITPLSFKRQKEIAEYILENLRPDEIHFEPVYLDNNNLFSPDTAVEYVSHYLEAYKSARSKNVNMIFSGSRSKEIHGPFCNINRNVLNLDYTDTILACFASWEQNKQGFYVIGEAQDEGLFLNEEKIERLKVSVSQNNPSKCISCFNYYHCAGLCPDICSIGSTRLAGLDPTFFFRCRLQALIGGSQILRAVEAIKSRLRPTAVLWKEM